MSDQPLDRDRTTKLVSTIFADDLHAKRVPTLAGTASGVLKGAALGIHFIGSVLALAILDSDFASDLIITSLDGNHPPEEVDLPQSTGRRVASTNRHVATYIVSVAICTEHQTSLCPISMPSAVAPP